MDFIHVIPSALTINELKFHVFHVAGRNKDIVIYKSRIVKFMGGVTCRLITRHVIIVGVLDSERTQLRK